MPRWIVLIAVLAGIASFGAGALVGAHTKATASPSRLVRGTSGVHVVAVTVGHTAAAQGRTAAGHAARR